MGGGKLWHRACWETLQRPCMQFFVSWRIESEWSIPEPVQLANGNASVDGMTPTIFSVSFVNWARGFRMCSRRRVYLSFLLDGLTWDCGRTVGSIEQNVRTALSACFDLFDSR